MRVVFHAFVMPYMDDPDVFVAQPIYEWQQTQQGQWVMQNAQDVSWAKQLDVSTMGHRVVIYGDLEPRLATEYFLRYNDVPLP